MSEPSRDGGRQYVNFRFLKVDPAWRRLPAAERQQGKHEFCQVVSQHADRMTVLAYSLVGIRGDCDFMLWRIGYELDAMQEMSAKLLATGLGKYLTIPYSYLSMTKSSIYLVGHEHDAQADSLAVLLDLTERKRLRLFESLLPVCCLCGKVRDDTKAKRGHGSWRALEEYVVEHSDADLTHTFCPDCYRTYREREGLPPAEPPEG